MDSFVISHYRRKAESWLKANFKFLKEDCMTDVIKIVVAGYTILYGVVIAFKAAALSKAGATIVYGTLLKASAVVALKFAFPVLLVVGGIVYIVNLVN